MTWKAFVFLPYAENSYPLAAHPAHFPRLFNNTMNCVAYYCNNYLCFGPWGLQQNEIVAHRDMNMNVYTLPGGNAGNGLMFISQQERTSSVTLLQCARPLLSTAPWTAHRPPSRNTSLSSVPNVWLQHWCSTNYLKIFFNYYYLSRERVRSWVTVDFSLSLLV